MRALIAGMLYGIGPCRTASERRDLRSWRERQKPTVISAFGRFSSLMDQGQQLDFEGDVVGCLCFLRARMVLDGSAGMRSGLVEIAVGRRIGRMLQNRRRHPLPPSGVAPVRELVFGLLSGCS